MKSKGFLQFNYTTPEQSRRLLELGVPADSADSHYFENCRFPSLLVYKFSYLAGPSAHVYLPCWSVGRLIEIYCICMGVSGFPHCYEEQVSNLILAIATAHKAGSLDFSKLEELL